MGYATQDDLVPARMTQKDLIELTDDTDSGEVNTAVVDTLLEEASGRVDSYCRQRYQTPLQASDVVKGLTLDIVTWLLFSRRRQGATPDAVGERNDAAIALLKDISTGKASLDQPAAQQAQGGSGAPVADWNATSGDADPLRFSDDNLAGYA